MKYYIQEVVEGHVIGIEKLIKCAEPEYDECWECDECLEKADCAHHLPAEGLVRGIHFRDIESCGNAKAR